MKIFAKKTALLIITALVSLTSFANQSITYTYNTDGQVLTENGPRTDVNDLTTHTYSTQGLLASTTNALGQVTTYTRYDFNGNLLSATSPNGVVTEFTYDELGLLLSSRLKHPTDTTLDTVTTYTYDAVGLLIGMVLPNGAALTFTYDDARRLTAVSNQLGESINYTLDAAGNRLSQTIKNNSGTITYSLRTAYDELSRVMMVEGNNGQQDQNQYDASDNLILTTDGRSHLTEQQYDVFNRVATVIDPALNETRFTYNTQNQIETVTDAKGLVTTYHYDGLGNLTSMISPDTGTATFTYDNAGNRTSATDSRGVVVNYTYDALNRLKQVQYPASPSETVTYEYDARTTTNRGIGKLTRLSKTGFALSYLFNHQGLVTQKNTNVAGLVRATKYAYDRAGQLTTITYPSGRIVSYDYDALGRIASVTTKVGSGATTTLVNNINYLPFGPAASYTYGNGLSLTHTVDQDYRLSAIDVGGINPILDRDYAYDPVNNITGITNNLNPNKSQSYGYDPLNRLTSATGVYGLLGYTYDAVGNRLSEHYDDGNQVRNDTYTYATNSHRLLGISRTTNNQADGTRNFTYDAAGNRVTGKTEDGKTQTHSYNHANRMSSVSVDDTSTATYVYNPLGQRVSKTIGTTTEVYYYDEAGQLISVTNSGGNVLREYIYLDSQQVAFVSNGTLYYIHNDHLNTPQVVTDQNQQVVWMADYQPFGKLAGTQTNNIELYSRFPGQYLDSETGLYYNYFRDYDPSIGRYIESDPIGLSGGINTYAYTLNNPLRYSDPLGLAPNKGCVLSYTAAGATIVGAIGYGGGFVGGGFAGAFVGGVGAIPGAAGGSQLGGIAGAAAGSGAGYMIAQWVCPDDDASPNEDDSETECPPNSEDPDKCKKARTNCAAECSGILPDSDLQSMNFQKCYSDCLSRAGCLGVK